MKKTTYKLFPTLIITFENLLSKEDCSQIFSFCFNKKDNLLKHSSLKGNSLSTHSNIEYQDFLSDIEDNITSLKDLKQRIKYCLDDYCEENGCGTVDFSNSWFNMTGKYSSLLNHVHPESVLSGALYVNVDDQSSSLYFFNPNQHIHFFESEKSTEYNFEHYSFKPTLGSLIIFPSWLTHGSHSDVNNTENRLVISFNTKKSGVRSMDRTGVF